MGNLFSTASATSEHLPLLPSLLRDDVVNWDLVRRVLRENPEQARLYAHGVDNSLLFTAVVRSAPPDVVQSLMNSDEDAIDQVSSTGETLLHAASSSDSLVPLILSHRPGFAKSTDSKGRLPLHLTRSASAAKCLIKANPTGLLQRSGELGSLPLHHVLLHHEVQSDLLRLLVKEATPLIPNCGILARNKRGQTPLGLLVEHLERDLVDSLWDVLLDWLQKLPRAQEAPNLHTLIDCGCCNSHALMQKALQHFGDDVWARDKLGRTALHIASLNVQCGDKALDALIRANPRAPRMTDNDGRLPIDLAAETPNTRPYALALLMKGEPRALNTRDLHNRQYPFQTSAMSAEQSVTNTYVLLRSRPEVLSYYHNP